MKPTKKAKNTAIVFVRMTPQQKEHLRKTAAAHDMSEAQVIRCALAEYVPVTRKVSQ